MISLKLKMREVPVVWISKLIIEQSKRQMRVKCGKNKVFHTFPVQFLTLMKIATADKLSKLP